MADLLRDTRVEPDVQQLLSVLRRQGTPRRVHHIELFLDPEIKEMVAGRYGMATGGLLDRRRALEREVRLHAFLGYDVFRVPVIRKDVFPLPGLAARDTAAAGANRGERDWVEEHRGPIASWAELERYPWPKVAEIDLTALEWMEKNLLPNMGVYDLTAHILEMVTFLMGYETLCYSLADDPELVAEICTRVGQFYEAYTRTLCDFRCVALIWGSDDMGYRTSTTVSPAFLRKEILPWHRRCADVAHRHGKPYLLHACGNLAEIMEDLIAEVGIDGKHSFEDAILPVDQAYRFYGERIAILGGLDVDFLCRAGQEEIRRRVRQILETCLPGGGYCLGTGNTVANYLPLQAYLTMLDEGRRFLA